MVFYVNKAFFTMIIEYLIWNNRIILVLYWELIIMIIKGIFYFILFFEFDLFSFF